MKELLLLPWIPTQNLPLNATYCEFSVVIYLAKQEISVTFIIAATGLANLDVVLVEKLTFCYFRMDDET